MTTPTLTPMLPEALASLRSSMLGDGWTASSPLTLDGEAETIAREERQD